MILHKYVIQHPTLNRQYGAQCIMQPPAYNEDAIRVIEKCIEKAKEVAIKYNMSYEEMIHTLNCEKINPNELSNYKKSIEPEIFIKYTYNKEGYTYESKTCAF